MSDFSMWSRAFTRELDRRVYDTARHQPKRVPSAREIASREKPRL